MTKTKNAPIAPHSASNHNAAPLLLLLFILLFLVPLSSINPTSPP